MKASSPEHPPIRRILVGSDLGGESGLALEASRHLGSPTEAEIHVIHVRRRPDPIPGVGDEAGAPGETALAGEKWQGSSMTEMRAQLAEVGLTPDDAHLHTRRGVPFREILRVAETVAPDLVVLGTHRPRRAFDGLIGATADRVIRSSPFPCLVVNRPVERRPRRIMVASDLSSHATHALEVAVGWAVGWSRAPGSEGEGVTIDVVRIADFARPGYRPSVGEEPLEGFAAVVSARTSGSVAIESRVVSYPLAPEGILRVAEETRPDLVVLGTHGHGVLIRALVGSVASEVIRTVPQAVVVVPPRPIDSKP